MTRTHDQAAVDPSTATTHEVIEPPTDLRHRVRSGAAFAPGGAEDPILRAERALATLEGQFPVWLHAELGRLSAAFDATQAQGLAGEPRNVLYRAAHDVRGQAATLGYPLAGHLADSLCLLLDQATDRQIPSTLLEQHVAAIRAIVNERASGDGTPVARELVTRLVSVTDEFIRMSRAKRRRQTKQA